LLQAVPLRYVFCYQWIEAIATLYWLWTPNIQVLLQRALFLAVRHERILQGYCGNAF